MRSPITTAATAILALALSTLPVAGNDAAADTTPTPAPSPAPWPSVAVAQPISLDTPFTLGLSETARFGDALAIRFDAVTEDSRCPADVACVWEGNAQVALIVGNSPEETAVLKLDSNPAFSTEANHGGYLIRLIGLDPYPRTDVAVPDPYRATLEVAIHDTGS